MSQPVNPASLQELAGKMDVDPLVLERDLYDLWFVFSQLDQPIDGDAVARLVPAKFALMSGGWKRERLYDRIRANEADWQEGLRYLVAEQPTFDDALSTVENALRVIATNAR